MPLTSQQIARADGQNAVWKRKLGGKWPSSVEFQAAGVSTDADLDAEAFLQQVAAYQEQHGLDADGVVGPKTAASIRGAAAWAPPAGADHLVINGKDVPVAGVPAVISFDEPDGLEFEPTSSGASLRESPVSIFCIHCKGAEGSALSTWSFLKSKGYGVHLSCERDGRIWQYADLATTATAHAGMVNGVSVGMEITNQQYPLVPNPHGRPEVSGPYAPRNPAGKNYGVPFERKVLGLLPPQIDSACRVIKVTCETLGIPKVIPGKDGKVYGGLLPQLRSVSNAKWKKLTGKVRFAGVIGHLNVTNGHGDPSPDIFHALLDHGFKLQDVGA